MIIYIDQQIVVELNFKVRNNSISMLKVITNQYTGFADSGFKKYVNKMTMDRL